MQKIPMTVVGQEKLSEELNHLKSVERPAVIDAIATARALGDLSENAEYHAAKDKQGFIEARIKQIEGALSLAEVIDPTTLSGSSVKFGATLKLLDEDTEDEIIYQIVGDEEADVKSGKISLTSPIARALIGKEQGDSVEVKTPGGQKFYEILTVEYK